MDERVDDNQEHVIGQAVRDFIDATLQGPAPDIDEFVKNYPGLEHRLKQKLQNLDKIDTLFDSLLQADESDFKGDVVEHNLAGRRIGSLEIGEMIGRGGMGVVYLARDTKLKRSVAVKSIPPRLAQDSTARTRFRREAELLATLNHPNIAIIHDIVEEGEAGYLVLEYVRGETLSQRIAGERITLEEALSMGQQIAEAISAAHSQGIVHRDLKPGNIKITPEGRVKVLDFGLAKAPASEAESGQVVATRPGFVVGTPAYMSPEQARGKPADERSDIWSFGCVLYEMLTGKILFEGETASDILARILEHEPNLDALPHTVPANIRVLIRRCLEKDPRQRLQHIGDAALEIRETVKLPSIAPPILFPSMSGRRNASLRLRTPAIITVISIAILATSLAVFQIRNASSLPSPKAIRVSMILQPYESIYQYRGVNSLALSPDGTRLVYVSSAKDRRRQLYIRHLDKFKAEPIPDTENAFDPFFSPDGRWLAFFTMDTIRKSTLWKLKIGGNEPRVRLAERTGEFSSHTRMGDYTPNINFYGASWSDDVILFCSYDPDDLDDSGYCLFQVPASGSVSKLVFKSDSVVYTDFADNSYPQLLPGGRAIISSGYNVGYLLVLETGERTTLIEDAQRLQYSPTGHLLFGRDEQIFAVPFDVGKLEITGPEVPLINDLSMPKWGHKPMYSVAANGTLAYVPVSSDLPSLVWVDHEGNSIPVLGAPHKRFAVPRLSPDESQIVVHTTPAETDYYRLWRHDLKRNVLSPLTPEGLWCHSPCWVQPDGKRVSFTASRDLAWMNVDGSGELELILPSSDDAHEVSQSWSSDGKYLAYYMRGSKPGIRILPIEDGGVPGKPIRLTGSDENNPMICPSGGRYIAYASKETGQSEVYVTELNWGNFGAGWVEKISPHGGTEPCWSRDGSRLYYRSPEGIVEVAIKPLPNGTIEVASDVLLFDDHMYGKEVVGITNYDVTSDGRFLMIKKAPHAQINVVFNWFEELKRLAPTGKE